MRVYDQEIEYDSEFDQTIETDERIWKENAELENKGRLIFKTSAPASCKCGEEWIELYEKCIIGRCDWDEQESREFKVGLAMIKEAWCDDKGVFVIEDYMECETLFDRLEHPYRLQYLVNKHRGIQEKVIEPWIKNEFENVDGLEM